MITLNGWFCILSRGEYAGTLIKGQPSCSCQASLVDSVLIKLIEILPPDTSARSITIQFVIIPAVIHGSDSTRKTDQDKDERFHQKI